MSFESLLETARQLRDPDTGCAWDREQTIESMIPPLLSEVDELRHALKADDSAHIAEELGDVLWNVVMMLSIGESDRILRVAEVLQKVQAKMIHRHPHVFGEETAASMEEAREAYQAAKRAETPE